MLSSSFFYCWFLTSFSTSPLLLHSTAAHPLRRLLLLHHSFLPLSSTTTTSQPPPSPPLNQSVTQTPPSSKAFFPVETPPPLPPPPSPFHSVGFTLPANISGLLLPHPPPPKHFSKTLLLIIAALLCTALFSILTLVFYCLSRRRYSAAVKAQRSDGLRLYPPNTTTSDGGRKPGDASLMSSDFLYLGTVVSSSQQGEVGGCVANSSVPVGMHSASSAYQKLGSPELHPLPPLPRQIFRSGCLSEGEMEEDCDEFFSPRGSPGGGRGSPATAVPNDNVEVFMRKFSSGTRSTCSFSSSSSAASFNSASLGSNKSKSPDKAAKLSPPPLSPQPPSPLNRRSTLSSSHSPASSPSSLSSSSHADPVDRSQQSRGSEDVMGVTQTRMNIAPAPPPLPPSAPPLFVHHRQQPAGTFASRPICQLVPETSGLTGDKREEGQKPKLKALHWDKVRATSDRVMVWDQLKSSSFQLNEEMIETLFVVNGSVGGGGGGRGSGGKENVQVEHRVALDQRKSHNIAILLKALNVTNDEVCEALLEGNVESLGREVLESLLKMAPSKEEEMRLKGFKEEESGVKLGAAERFLRDVIHIPFAFKRINAMLYIANFHTEVEYLITSFHTLEAACEELRRSRMLLKVLDAVLKTGNRMNVGTNRGDALAFKLDTLLKLVDVKGGGDGKTTLMHFVVQEMMAREEKVGEEEEEEEGGGGEEEEGEMGKKRRGKRGGVEWLSREMVNVKKAAGMDAEVLRGDVVRVMEGICKVEEVVELNEEEGEGSRKLSESMKGFLREGREMVRKVEEKERGAMSLVRETTEYFHGDSAKEEAHPLRIFTVVRDFLSTLDRVCREVSGEKMKPRFIMASATALHFHPHNSTPNPTLLHV